MVTLGRHIFTVHWPLNLYRNHCASLPNPDSKLIIITPAAIWRLHDLRFCKTFSHW